MISNMYNDIESCALMMYADDNKLIFPGSRIGKAYCIEFHYDAKLCIKLLHYNTNVSNIVCNIYQYVQFFFPFWQPHYTMI